MPVLVILFLKNAGEFVIHDPGELLKQRWLLFKEVLIVEEHMRPALVCFWVKVLGKH